MKCLLKKLLSFNIYSGKPLKYRESNYTLSELERRLNSEVNGFRNKGW